MALPHTQPIQAILPDGTEVKAERQDIWDLYRLVEPYIGKASARWCAQGSWPIGAPVHAMQTRALDSSWQDVEAELKAEEEEANSGGGAAKTINPQRVIDSLEAAKVRGVAELDVVVDIVGMVESAQFLSVAYAPRRAEISLMTREKAVQLSDRRDRMGAASAQLRAGAAALAGPLERDNRFLSDVRELLGPESDGRVMLGGAVGPEAVRIKLEEMQRAALWRGIHGALLAAHPRFATWAVRDALEHARSSLTLLGSGTTSIREAPNEAEGPVEGKAAAEPLPVKIRLVHVATVQHAFNGLRGTIVVEGDAVLLEGPLWPQALQGTPLTDQQLASTLASI
ncbi:hypothetical protein QBZ16_002815 [Prototheca wickerhamii]|uniref:Uncharacterized protein n=1 Tax=Prototheca wickerhamii TaxID=3111 RepID=A0AAD9MHU9_PROWI|nr:hypothetical protein QBZ16_002815 [Prototheca wickerhamii]